MARYTGPKRRLSRMEGLPLFSKDVAFMERKGATPPGQHGMRGRRRLSEYGLQLREKQKAKRIYGVLEKQFNRYYHQAARAGGSTGLSLLQALECRLDNVVYRLGLTPSRMGARQIVSHGHILVCDKKVNIPSYCLRVGQTVAICGKMLDNTQVKKSLEATETLPEWLQRRATVGKVLRLPNRDEMEQGINEQLIVEYYSR